ncbi:unnamed protein product, partial [marine sediment metagenome]
MPSLSKSKFLAGWQCPKKLWLDVHEPDLAEPTSAAQQRIFDQGIKVGEIARGYFPGGVLIDADHLHIPDALVQTHEALMNHVDVIFEGA